MKSITYSLGTIALVAVLTACGTAPMPMNNAQTGAMAGAVLGGVAGNQFGQGEGKTAATIVGTMVGSAVGSQVGAQQDRYYQQPQPAPYYNRGY
ncbi:Glycine zipper 2TM domain-containing protein [Thiothrix caldifontis]|jgi:Predicted outer membrane lipoprotein|uniref:Glycine zipper 2TM domain-containing protein n=1 Tax=Thiothrix caldifontis TaxID=525918 RepID=A0A1H4EFR7_9GAMM|nr:glycine zipper 2TM domain-containing protein [Thiothrix caldifontis]SEA83687.1 Glycine zipper 2TM domain-containing protein [Thiothrix caldifontis]